MEKLSRKQERALELIAATTREQGFPPTLAELTDALGAASRNTAVKYLKILARKGYISWEHNKARGIQLLHSKGLLDSADEVSLPLIGTVPAGTPMLAEQNIERYVTVPRHLLRSTQRHFLLRVRGDSMTGAGILSGDLVVVRSQADADIGEVVVALMDGEATVKRLAVSQGMRFLRAENPAHRNLNPAGDWAIQGKVVALIREEVG